MSVEVNKAIVRRWNEEAWKGNPAVFDEILASNCIIHGIGGPQEIKEALSNLRRALPDGQLTIEDQIAEQDKVVTRWTIRGTHQGELWGTAPTGKQVTYTGISINRVSEGKIVEDWFEADILGVMQQIGAIPSPEQTGG
ncbi:MAG: ester cyclase [Candidatus Thorarchaeota archaeon]|jgi:predicted ester cyclase